MNCYVPLLFSGVKYHCSYILYHLRHARGLLWDRESSPRTTSLIRPRAGIGDPAPYAHCADAMARTLAMGTVARLTVTDVWIYAPLQCELVRTCYLRPLGVEVRGDLLEPAVGAHRESAVP